MPRLALVRHAKAEVEGPTDFERNLAARGHEQSLRLGSILSGWLQPGASVLLSPAHRTQQTWQGIAQGLGTIASEQLDLQVTAEPRIYDGSAGDLLALVNESNAQQLVIVGHNPGIARLALLLADALSPAQEEFLRDFRTSSVALFEAPLEFADWGPGLASLSQVFTGNGD